MTMKNYWVSWIHIPEDNEGQTNSFEYHGPWWISGYKDHPHGPAHTIVAAVKAESEDDAIEIIEAAYDGWMDLDYMGYFRFVEERPDDWTPFNDRFKKASWMQW